MLDRQQRNHLSLAISRWFRAQLRLEMAFAGRCGIDLKLPAGPGSLMEQLFNEAPGLVYEVRRTDLGAVQRIFDDEGVRAVEIGATRQDLLAAPGRCATAATGGVRWCTWAPSVCSTRTWRPCTAPGRPPLSSWSGSSATCPAPLGPDRFEALLSLKLCRWSKRKRASRAGAFKA